MISRPVSRWRLHGQDGVGLDAGQLLRRCPGPLDEGLGQQFPKSLVFGEGGVAVPSSAGRAVGGSGDSLMSLMISSMVADGENQALEDVGLLSGLA